jgi:hypothetical protein
MSNTNTGKVNMTIPFTTINSLCESHQDETFSSMIQSSPFASKIALRRDKMRVDADVMKSLFDKTINNIVSLVVFPTFFVFVGIKQWTNICSI